MRVADRMLLGIAKACAIRFSIGLSQILRNRAKNRFLQCITIYQTIYVCRLCAVLWYVSSVCISAQIPDQPKTIGYGLGATNILV